MIDFPGSPITGQQYPTVDPKWEWNGYAWDAIPVTVPGPPTGGSGAWGRQYFSHRKVSRGLIANMGRNVRATVLYDPPIANVQSMLYFDGANGSSTFTDQIAGRTWSNIGSPVHNNAAAYFGSTAAYFDGSSYIETPDDPSLEFGSGDWCVEFWMRPQVSWTGQDVIGKRPAAGSGWVLYQSGASLALYVSSNGSSWNVLNNFGATSLSMSTWYWVIINRRAGIFRMYLNSTLVGTSAYFADSIVDNTNSLKIGGNSNAEKWTGHIDMLRFTVGDAVYPASGGLGDPRTNPYPNT